MSLRAGGFAIGLLAFSGRCLGSEPVTVLPEVTVSGHQVAVESLRAAPAPFDSGLFGLPGLTLQAQGVGQTDLRIRGAAFNSSGISLAGIALRNPQTEHFDLELPFPSALLTSPELLTGVDQVLESTAHFEGSVSAQFSPVSDRRIVQAGVGGRGSSSTGFFAESHIPGTTHWGASVFGFQERRGGLDYSDNDMNRWQGGMRLQYAAPGTQVDLVGAHQHKHFGARGFYGAPAAFPSVEDLDDSLLMASGRWDRDGGAGYIRLTGYWRRLEDHYVLDRNNPTMYENRHVSRVGAVAADGREPILPERLALLWRLDGEQERLDSTAFGNFRRERLELMLAPVLTCGKLQLTAGLRSLAFSDDSPAWLGLARAVYHLDDANRLFVGYSQNTRRPSYTELYYRSTSSIGNPNLGRENSSEVEIGWAGKPTKHISAHVTVFQRRTRHTVDWIRTAPASAWQASDLGTVRTRGAEVGVRFRPDAPWTANLSYTFLDKNNSPAVYASRYVLDYAQHQLSATLRWQIVHSLDLYTTQTLLRQAANRARTSSRNAVLGTAGIGYEPPYAPGLLLTLELDNVWGDDFQVFPGQRPSARTLYATATYTF